MTGVEIVQELVSILVSGITQLGAGIGSGVNSFATALAIQGTGDNATLSIFMAFVAAFAAVALSIAITRRVFGWLETLSGRN